MDYASELLYLFSGICTAISLLAFYYRLEKHVDIAWFRTALHATFAITLVLWLTFAMMTIVPCVSVLLVSLPYNGD